MSDVMKGNFKPKKTVKVHDEPEDLTSKFEREALRRLGGSIAFVSKKKFLYRAEESINNPPYHVEDGSSEKKNKGSDVS